MQAHDTTQTPAGDARWRVIAADLRTAILDGRYLPGAALPSEPELVRRYEVSRPTVRKAIETLVSEGLVYVMRGRGSFVRPMPARHLILISADDQRPDLASPAYHPDVRAFGWKLARRDWADEPFGSQRVTADRNQAALLGLRPGHHLIHRHSRWSFAFGGRVEINSYTDADLVPDFEDPKRSAQYRKRAAFFYQTIQREHGPVRWTTTIGARLPYEEERAQLGMEYADAILTISRAQTTRHGRILETTHIKVPASHFETAPMSEATDIRAILEDPEEAAELGIAFVI